MDPPEKPGPQDPAYVALQRREVDSLISFGSCFWRLRASRRRERL